MRRALLALSVILIGVTTLAGVPSAKQDAIDGITMVDFQHPANFKVGSWAHYRVNSRSQLGFRQDYDVWLLIAGEEEFWGERCFWLETWTLDHGADTLYTASLITYAAFGDSGAVNQPMWLERKTVQGTGEDGTPDVSVGIRDRSMLRQGVGERGRPAPEDPTHMDRGFDTLAVDTARVPAGDFKGRVAVEVTHIYQETVKGDTTLHYDRVQSSRRKLDPRIPITRVAREDDDDLQTADVWMTGMSSGKTRRVLEHAIGSMTLLEYGDHGLMPRIVPEITPRRSSIELRRVTPTGSIAVPPPGATRPRHGG
jgi:hypothetical protein